MKRLGPNGKLIAFDQDTDAIANAIKDPRFVMVDQNFQFMKNWVRLSGYKKVDGITSMSQGFQNQYEFVKTNGNFTVYGTEFLIQKQFRHITSWVSYTFQENTRKRF